jgi:hypothetical protein
VQQLHPATQSHAHNSHCPQALSVQQQPALDFAPANETFAAASSAASAPADCVAQQDFVLATFAAWVAQQTQAQPSSQMQTPVSQHWQPTAH